MNKQIYRICRNCVMDTSDPSIRFDDTGLCKYCENFNGLIAKDWQDKLAAGTGPIASEIRAYGSKKDFDCIIGISGGLDSSFLTHIAVRKMGLRPLLFHVDAGWNTNKAVSNIEKLIDGLGLELYTEVVNWEDMKEFHRALFLSQIPDQDIPQDAVFFSAMYKFARKHKIKYILTGSNYSLECVREPEEWGGYLGIDMRLISSIIGKFGRGRKLDLPLLDIFIYRFYYRWILGMRVVGPLDMVPYVKVDAERVLNEEYGWEPFQHKHHESRFTRFFEDFWLPRKFGFEKRRAHFSSMILTKQMARKDALERLESPELEEDVLKREFDYVADKLDFTVQQFQEVFGGQNKTFAQYPNRRDQIEVGRKIYRWLGLDKRTVR